MSFLTKYGHAGVIHLRSLYLLNGKYLAIMRSPREDVCDIEQDKIKGVEDEMTYQSLTFIDLETMQSQGI
jgi:hypothetical protein